MKLIPLSGKKGAGLFAKVDDEAFLMLSERPWFPWISSSGKIYAKANSKTEEGKRKTIQMHSFLMRAKPGEQVDHQDGDGLNNQRSNLRKCTVAQNAMNRAVRRDNTTGFKGVSREGSRFTARIKIDGKLRYVGTCATSEKAARAYDAKAREHFGEFARLNFPMQGEQAA